MTAAQLSVDSPVPPFEPHPWLRGPHRQTVVGRYWGGPRRSLHAIAREIQLPDGDRLVVLESVPARQPERRPTAVLVHGLAGCAGASYMVRLARRLLRQGTRVVRINLRGAGAGFGLARGIYHAGRSDDVREVVEWVFRSTEHEESPIAVIGFSLGANLVLKFAAEAADLPVAGLDCVLAANPPIDLANSAQRMQRLENRFYDWNFVRWLRISIDRLHRRFPELGPTGLDGVRTLYHFDDRYTAPRNGFRSADDYYARCSLLSGLPRIQVPGLIVHAMDDPVIAFEPLLEVERPPRLALELIPHGGHLGYLSRKPWLGDHRWLEARLATWLRARWTT
jgi:predicted alpha/beta-fold hydrolase